MEIFIDRPFYNSEGQKINSVSGIDARGALKILGSMGIIHAFNTHGDHKKESERGQIGIVDSDFELLPEILSSPDNIERGNQSKKGEMAVLFQKRFKNKLYHVVMVEKSNKSEKKLVFGTMYIKPCKDKSQ